MLLQLEIENIAIIERLNIGLEPGLNILTGETGAGKSILIDSINALLGSRISRELIRSGTEKATVQGLFTRHEALVPLLAEFGVEPEEDGTILISRTMTESGRNVCRVNGSLVTVAMLKAIGERLVDIHGQHDNQSLLRVETHIGLLDLFAGEKLARVKEEYQKELRLLNEFQARLKSLSGEGRERERLIESLKYQIDEIRRAALYIGEDEELMRQSRILAHAEDIISAFSQAYEALKGEETEGGGAEDGIQTALDAVRRVEGIDSAYASICAALDEINEKVADLSREIRHTRDGVEYDPNLHKSTEERISLIQGLKKKYGASIQDILAYEKNSADKLDELERSGELIESLRAQIASQREILDRKCLEMNRLRGQAAGVLVKGVMKELSDLEMPKTKFSADIQSVPAEGYTPDGTDRVEFLISPNPGEPLKPLSRIASGGEMSRVMLAIKAILADMDLIPTLIFDEIDSGVSGKAASRVGEKLRALGKSHQVLCITHHAQIASLADSHVLISKSEQDGRTVTSVRRLEGHDREEEITRLLSGEHVTDASRKLARELLGTTE